MDNKIRYNRSVLKEGYEEMAKINLSYAESGLASDQNDLLSYETSLSRDEIKLINYSNVESDSFDD